MTLRIAAVLAGLLLGLIGLRFLLDPVQAQRTFGLGKGETGQALHAAVGLRDVWLALLVLAFAWLCNWTALALWFGFGALVCFGDAAIVASAGGRWLYFAFHAVSGAACAFLALLAVRAGRSRAAGEAQPAPGTLRAP